MTTQLIGITGLAYAGKDSLAACFAGYGYKRVAFANALKEVTSYIAGEPTHLYFTQEGKEEFCDTLGMTRREALQRVGVAMRNTLGEDVWVKRLLQEWVSGGLPPTVISDCRFLNEASAIRDLGGVIVQVVRPGSGLSGSAALHESESGIPEGLIDYVVNNDGTLGDLAAEAGKIFREVGDHQFGAFV